VVIPTRGRPGAVARCVAALRDQRGAPPFEVLVAIDGPDAGEVAAIERVRGGLDVRAEPGDPAGPGAARNRVIRLARAPLLLLLNDDVVPDPELVAVHAREHARLAGAGRPAMVLGDAPFAVQTPDRLFDRLIRETSMVFFYDRMRGQTDPGHDWGFRHAWTLNLSMPSACVREVGGFCESLPGAAFEDIELAWRLHERFGAPVLHRPSARVTHHHRYEPAGYLAREESLGRDAVALARANPACARATFGRDITAPEETAYARASVERERGAVDALRETFMRLAALPPDAPGDPEIVRALYEHHLPLKRWHWRVGLLSALDGRAVRAA